MALTMQDKQVAAFYFTIYKLTTSMVSTEVTEWPNFHGMVKDRDAKTRWGLFLVSVWVFQFILIIPFRDLTGVLIRSNGDG